MKNRYDRDRERTHRLRVVSGHSTSDVPITCAFQTRHHRFIGTS